MLDTFGFHVASTNLNRCQHTLHMCADWMIQRTLEWTSLPLLVKYNTALKILVNNIFKISERWSSDKQFLPQTFYIFTHIKNPGKEIIIPVKWFKGLKKFAQFLPFSS